MPVPYVLRRHPIPISCHLEHSLMVSWALPIATLEPLVPPGLVLDTYDDRWGFVAIAVVQARALRPTGLPRSIGRDHRLSGYRLFVRHTDPTGRSRRGLHILRSDTDRRLMRLGGNLLTHYGYALAEIGIRRVGGSLEVRIVTPGHEADLSVVAHLDQPATAPPDSSPFRSLAAARRFAGPLPWTFDHEPETDSIIAVHGRRSAWQPRATPVEVRTCTYFDHGPFAGADARLANAYHVADIDYAWERGVRIPNRRAAPSAEAAVDPVADRVAADQLAVHDLGVRS